jgi:TATA-box binding protein (TBP) (component of TFIID and TFIIIB)
VNLNRVIQRFDGREEFRVSFDPDRYSAVKVKFQPRPGTKQVTASIFSTGKIIVTGAQTLEEIALAYNTLNANLDASVRLNESEKKDEFGVIMGHTFMDWVPVLQAKGVEAWVA